MLGARQSLLQLVRGLDPSRYVPHVAVPQPGGLTEALDAAGIGWTALRLRPWRKAKSWPFIPIALRRLRRLAADLDAALLHANEVYPTPYAVRSCPHLPTICHVRLEAEPNLFRKYDAGRASAVVAVSEAVEEVLRHPEARVLPDRLHVIYNGLELDSFAAEATVAPASDSPTATALSQLDALIQRTQAENPGEPLFVLGQFGLLTPRKRHADVLAALAGFNSGGSPAPRARVLYLVLGDAGPRDVVAGQPGHPAEVARHLGVLADATTDWNGRRAMAMFVPFQQTVAPFMARCHAVVLPSDQEGFGRVLIEAAALGLPALGSTAGGIREVVRDGETGLIFPVGDVGALGAAIARLADDAPLRTRLGAAGRDCARARFSLAAHCQQVMALYDELILARRAKD